MYHHAPMMDWPVGRAADLPDWHELLAAFTSGGAVQSDTHPVTWCGWGLARLHQVTAGLPPSAVSAGTAHQRAVLIAVIDAWVAANVRRPAQGAAAGSLGAYVDRMALAAVTAHRLLRTCDPVSDQVHTAWSALAALAAGWTDIIAEAVPPYQQEDAVTDGGD
jgi:hypothetical protein